MIDKRTPIMNRRELLTTVGTGSMVLAGCTGRADPELSLGRIEIQNRSTEPVETRVTITKDGEERYRETFSFDAADYDADPPYTTGDILVEEWFGDPAEYELTVAIVNGELNATSSTSEVIDRVKERYADTPADGTCFAFYVKMGDEGELDAIRIGEEIIRSDDDTLPYADSCG